MKFFPLQADGSLSFVRFYNFFRSSASSSVNFLSNRGISVCLVIQDFSVNSFDVKETTGWHHLTGDTRTGEPACSSNVMGHWISY